MLFFRYTYCIILSGGWFMFDEKTLYLKLKNKEIFTDEECEWLTYYESLRSRSDKDHDENKDPLVGALIRNKEGHVLAVSHRASGQEGDHAEYVLLKNKLSGEDLTGCHLFTTLEPCVDDSRSEIGKSCSSIICMSELKDVHIGILDPNPIVNERGLSTLFKNGIRIYPYSNKLVGYIFNSCEAFRNPTPLEQDEVKRFKKDVLPYFDEMALNIYLKDLCKANGKKLEDYESILNIFALELVRKGLVKFNAKNIEVDNSIKIMFYKTEYLTSELNRKIKIINQSNPEIDRDIQTIDYPLPITFHYFENNFKYLNIDEVVFREIIANLIIHRSYDANDSLSYFIFDEVEAHFTNDAAKNLNHSHLQDLSKYKASSKPGNGIIADYFNKANYCERSKKGQKTFLEFKDKITITVSDSNTVDVRYKYF